MPHRAGLQATSVGDVIERATFDPDVTLLGVGHPLIRRLIEKVKQNAFREGLATDDQMPYSRTAYDVTPDVDEVIALFHLLARYVVNANPTAIVEELLPVALPVYSLDPLAITGDLVEPLLNPEPSGQARPETEVQEALADALGIPALDSLLEATVEERRQALVAERTRMQRPDNSSSQPAEWLEGIDDLAPGSLGLPTVTVLFPA